LIRNDTLALDIVRAWVSWFLGSQPAHALWEVAPPPAPPRLTRCVLPSYSSSAGIISSLGFHVRKPAQHTQDAGGGRTPLWPQVLFLLRTGMAPRRAHAPKAMHHHHATPRQAAPPLVRVAASCFS